MAYFSRFQQFRYSFDGNVTSKVAVDILKRVGFKAKVKDNSELFADYYINDGETPDIVADRVYGNSELHWVVLLFNDIVNPDYDWALASPKLESFIKKKYPGTAFHIVEAPALGTCGDNNDQGYNSAKFRRNMTLLKADGNSYTSMDDIRYAEGFQGLVYKYDRDLSKLEITGITGSASTGDFIFAVGTSADGSTFNVGAKIKRIVTNNFDAVHHFENPVDGSHLNPFGSAPVGVTGEQSLLGSTGNADGSITSGITYGASLIYDYMKNGTSTYVVTNRSYEEKENEGKRIIKLPRPDMIQLITKEYERLMQD
jgi:hypothetical protein